MVRQLAGCGEAGQRYRDGLGVLGDDGRLVAGEVGHERAEGRGPVGARWLGPDAVWWWAGQHAQEPAWLQLARRNVQGGQHFAAAQAGAVRAGSCAGDVAAVVGVPADRAVRADLAPRVLVG